MSDKEKLDKLEKRVAQLEYIVANLTYSDSTKQICVYERADNYLIRVPLHRYIHEYCNDFKDIEEEDKNE